MDSGTEQEDVQLEEEEQENREVSQTGEFKKKFLIY